MPPLKAARPTPAPAPPGWLTPRHNFPRQPTDLPAHQRQYRHTYWQGNKRWYRAGNPIPAALSLNWFNNLPAERVARPAPLLRRAELPEDGPPIEVEGTASRCATAGLNRHGGGFAAPAPMRQVGFSSAPSLITEERYSVNTSFIFSLQSPPHSTE